MALYGVRLDFCTKKLRMSRREGAAIVFTISLGQERAVVDFKTY